MITGSHDGTSRVVLTEDWYIVWAGLPAGDWEIAVDPNGPVYVKVLNAYPDSASYYIEFQVADASGNTSALRAVVLGTELEQHTQPEYAQ